jgi:hypothetical protein
MKILINLFGIGFILLFSHFYKTESTSVEGMWLTADKLSKIQIYEENGKYHGKIAWLKQPSVNGNLFWIPKTKMSPCAINPCWVWFY